MRVSEYYKLGRNQATLKFIDVDIKNDARLFVNARAIRLLESEWGEHCEYLLSNFFQTIIDSIRVGDGTAALTALQALREPNETHLGLSAGESDGRGLGPQKAYQIWKSLKQSKAVETGLLSDLEDTVLLVDGVSVDILSDVVTNIIRGPLITFTQETCEEYGIPMEKGVASGPVWNPGARCWEEDFVSLPLPEGEKLILVPKSIVRVDADYKVGQYYRHYVLESMKIDEIARNSELVYTIKSGARKGERTVTKTSLEKKYGSQQKSISIDYTNKRPDLLEKYKRDHSAPTPALTHRQIAEAQGLQLPDWKALLQAVTSLEPGRKQAYLYEDAITDLLSALFHPVLVDPEKQSVLHGGIKRVDLRFTNYARSGFFEWLSRHYSCSYIFVECKNFGEELGNPEIDQIAMRFSKERGQFGIVVCRNVENADLLDRRCKAAAQDGHGFVVVLSDSDLGQLIEESKEGLLQTYEFPTLRRKFNQLIM
ncbi:hypothetical protein GQF56_10425 [Rhodobacter sphaeroides]|uniref:Restriction endonuclease type IV Mrr domain-containing protein n=1 Tax=Cereibacter sphaeroides (strain ATCC 17023 / DSM 158 / JCM 6121 / CCUG 31486 / LMG 2827 / NBRC 12203 / NCIMB 8253 / ATH 2.4.1.) TaxID=272943 RepID=Q3J3X0_CERS4|nr:hypothetical protein RSP_2356 [Cereibacter sphaeroides 2.4.1]AXC62812.1 hypothetical protein DQL45_04950 [Cereibacter sphaeroides 2.4.1]MVX48289.1 hypothetical protein [Cereibacter sphaeroides]